MTRLSCTLFAALLASGVAGVAFAEDAQQQQQQQPPTSQTEQPSAMPGASGEPSPGGMRRRSREQRRANRARRLECRAQVLRGEARGRAARRAYRDCMRGPRT